MVFHGISIFFPVKVDDFQPHVDDLNSNEIIDLIISADLLMGK